VVEPGPLTAAIELSGRHQDEAGGAFLDYTLRLRLNAGRPELHLAHAFLNLGDEEEGVAVGEIGLGLPSAGREVSHVVAQLASGMTSFPRLCEVPEDVEINVGRTGARIADLDSLREDTSQYPPYLMKNRDLVEPYVGLRGQGWSAVAFLRECQQNHPKRLRACGGGLEFHMWPDGAELPALRQGMARTHEAVIAFLPPDAPAVDMHRTFYQWESPATVTVPFEWYRRCEVFGMQYVMPWLPRRYRRIEANLASTIERAWVSGMFAYGDDPVLAQQPPEGVAQRARVRPAPDRRGLRSLWQRPLEGRRHPRALPRAHHGLRVPQPHVDGGAASVLRDQRRRPRAGGGAQPGAQPVQIH